MLHNVTLLNRTINVIPPLRIHSHPLALLPLLRTPPSRQDTLPLLRQIQELAKGRPRVFAGVDPDVLAPILTLVFDAHAETVDQLREGLFLGQLVEIIVLVEPEDAVGGVEAGVVRSRGGGCRGGLGLAGTDELVGFPVCFLAVAGAVECCWAFGTVLELLVCLALEHMACVALTDGFRRCCHFEMKQWLHSGFFRVIGCEIVVIQQMFLSELVGDVSAHMRQTQVNWRESWR
jgi:hypothetical protein